MKGKFEREYLEIMRNYPDAVYNAHNDSVQEGFEYFYENFKKGSKKNQSWLDIIRIMRSSGTSLKGVFIKLKTIFKYRKDLLKEEMSVFLIWNHITKNLKKKT